jgi:hypothetical protein
MVFFLFILILIIIFVVTYWYIVLPLVILGLIWFFKSNNKAETKQTNSNYSYNYSHNYSHSNKSHYSSYNQKTHRSPTSTQNYQKQTQNQEKQIRLDGRLQRYNLTESEAEIIFGTRWKTKFKKTDTLFFFDVIDVEIKLDYDTGSFRAKLGNLVTKFEKLVEIVERENPELTKDKRTWYTKPNFSNSSQDNQYNYEPTPQVDNSEIQWAFKVLELAENSDIYAIRAKYRELSLLYHPDRNNSPDSTKKMSDINNAFELLTKFVGAA